MTDKTDNSGSAFPNDGAWANGVPEPGLTKREYAAIHIAAGMLASDSAVAMLQAQSMHDHDENATFNITGRIAVKFADALLAALKGGE